MEEGDGHSRSPVEKPALEDVRAEELERGPEDEKEDAPAAAALEALEGREARVEDVLPDRVGEVAVRMVEEGPGEVADPAVDLDPLVDVPALGPEAPLYAGALLGLALFAVLPFMVRERE